MRIKLHAFKWFSISSIFILLLTYLLNTYFIKNIHTTFIGSLLVGFLASLLVLSGATLIEYYLIKERTIQTFFQACYWYLSLVSEAKFLTSSRVDIETCYEKWINVNTFYENDFKTSYFNITKYRRGKVKYKELEAVYDELSSFHDNHVQKIFVTLIMYLSNDDVKISDSEVIQGISSDFLPPLYDEIRRIGWSIIHLGIDKHVIPADMYFKSI